MVVIVILAHAIARVLKIEKILVGRGASFCTGSAGPLVASPQQELGSDCVESWLL
jgi:hypothetical protein